MREEKVLFPPLDLSDERNVIGAVFGPDCIYESVAYKEFLDYYKAELQKVNFSVSSREASRHSFLVTSHSELSVIIRIAQQHVHSTRPEIQEIILQLRGDQNTLKESLNRCIDLALRVVLMLNVRKPCFALQTLQTPVLQWDDTTTLLNFINRQFSDSPQTISSRDSRINPLFTVPNMISICGLQIEWTQSLQDHLRLDRRAKTLRIFSYKNCLWQHLRNAKQGNTHQ